jgi:hypothetical protein
MYSLYRVYCTTRPNIILTLYLLYADTHAEPYTDNVGISDMTCVHLVDYLGAPLYGSNPSVPKSEIFVTELFILSDPIWVSDLRTEPINLLCKVLG